MDYKILTVEDVSSSHAKRYSSIVQISPCPRDEMLAAIRGAIEKLSGEVVHHNKQHKARWTDTKPHIVYLFVTKSTEVEWPNWACRAVWVDTELEKEFHPPPLGGEWVDKNLEVLWQ